MSEPKQLFFEGVVGSAADSEPVLPLRPSWRTGRPFGKALYANDEVVAVFPTRELAEYAANALNYWELSKKNR